MTEKNSRPHRNHRTGKLYFACRRCETQLIMLRYHADPAFRAATIARSRAYKAAMKEARS